MDVGREQLNEIAASVWESMLDMSADPSTSSALTGELITSCVHITGAWSGIVSVRARYELAMEVAASMFAMEPGDASDEDVHDAFGELANMVGGNVKAIVQGPGKLSLPVVTSGANSVAAFPGAELIDEAHFTCDVGPFIVTLYRSPEAKVEAVVADQLAPGEEDADELQRECPACACVTTHRELRETTEEDRVDSLVINARVSLFKCLTCNTVDPELILSVRDDGDKAQVACCSSSSAVTEQAGYQQSA